MDFSKGADVRKSNSRSFTFDSRDISGLLVRELIYQLTETTDMPYNGTNVPRLPSLRHKGETCQNYACGKFFVINEQLILLTATTSEGEVLLMVDCQRKNLVPTTLVFEDTEARQQWLNRIKVGALLGQFNV